MHALDQRDELVTSTRTLVTLSDELERRWYASMLQPIASATVEDLRQAEDGDMKRAFEPLYLKAVLSAWSVPIPVSPTADRRALYDGNNWTGSSLAQGQRYLLYNGDPLRNNRASRREHKAPG